MIEKLDFSCKICDGKGLNSCSTCRGNGYITITCNACGGRGYHATDNGYDEWFYKNCGGCGGSGKQTQYCSSCDGTGSNTCTICNGSGEDTDKRKAYIEKKEAEKKAYIEKIEKEKYERANLSEFILSINIDKLQRYIKEGSSINHQNKDGETSLLIAIKNNKIDLAKVLINSGANAVIKDNSGNSALIYAMKNKQIDIAKLIIEKLPSISSSESFFKLAMNNGLIDIAKMIYKKNSDIILTREEAVNYLIFSGKINDIEIAQIMLKIASINSYFDNQYTALSAAVESNSKEMINFLLDNNANPNCSLKDNENILMTATKRKDFELVIQLLNKGAIFNLHGSKKDYSALDIIIEHSQLDLVESILKANICSQEVIDYAFLTMLSKKQINLAKKYVNLVKDVNIFREKNETAVVLSIMSKDTELINSVLGKENLVLNIKTKNEYSPMGMAISNNDLNLAKKLKELGASVTFADSKAYPLSHIAIKNKNLEMLKFLEENSVKIIENDYSNKSELMAAVTVNKKEIIDYLLEKGSDINNVNNKGESVITEAIRNNVDLAIIICLIENSVDLNFKTAKNETLFLLSCEMNRYDIVEYLLKQNKNLINEATKEGETPLKKAVKNKNTKLVKLLIENKADVNTLVGIYPLEIAVINNDINTVEVLLKAGANPNTNYLLIEAAKKSTNEIVELLLKYKADPNIKNNNSETPLEIAVKNNDINKVEILLKAGANPNTNYLLIEAIKKSTNEIVELLLKYKADPNIINEQEEIALFIAFELQKNKMIESLLKNNADLKQKDKNWETILFYAVKSAMIEYVRQFVNKETVNVKNKNRETPIFYAAMSNEKDIAEILIENKADLTVIDNKNRTPFLCAIDNESWDVAQVLFDKKPQLDKKDNNGNTALILAIKKGKKDFIKRIIEQSSKEEINLLNNRKENALIVATQLRDKETVKMLLDKKANKKQARDDRRKAIDIARENNDLEIISLLSKVSPIFYLFALLLVAIGLYFMFKGDIDKNILNKPIQQHIQETKKSGLYSLEIMSNVNNPIIKIMNIKPKFKQGMMLKKDKYEILIQKDGYKTKRQFIDLNKDMNILIKLDKVK